MRTFFKSFFLRTLIISFIGLLALGCCTKVLDFSNKPDFQSGQLKSLNNIIVRYNPEEVNQSFLDTLELLKEEATEFECPCQDADGNKLILLQFNQALDSIEIESKLGSVSGSTGSGAQGDRDFEFNRIPSFSELTQSLVPVWTIGKRIDSVKFPTFTYTEIQNLVQQPLKEVLGQRKLEDLVLKNNDNFPIIAVLDTGLDPGLFFDSEPFLYDTSIVNENCNLKESSPSGLNFVHPGANVFDGHGHGSLVTKIITNRLGDNNNYRILPLKILDEKGKGTYWNMICALSYLSNVQKHSGNLKVINSSFGGVIRLDSQSNNPGELNQFNLIEERVSIFRELMNQLDESYLVASAGNKGENNDELYHYPSNINGVQKIAVGGYHIQNQGVYDLHPDSNFGTTTVDLVTQFENYEFEFKNELGSFKVENMNGTSFGAAFISSEFFDFLLNNTSICGSSDFLSCFLQNNTKVSQELNGKIQGNRFIEFEN